MISRAHEIYPLDLNIKRELEKIRQDPNNSEALLGYYNRRVAEQVSKARILKCMNTLRVLSAIHARPFKESTREDFERLLAEISNREYSDWTRRDFIVIFKRFYRWLVRWPHKKTYPPEIDWIELPRKIENKNPVHPKDLLTQNEKLALLYACQNPRDRAFIDVYNESGRRPGEILTLHTADVEFDSIGAKLFVHGKKGEDYVRIITSAPTLAQWLDVHPLKDVPDAPLWIGLGYKNRGRQLTYPAARSLIKKIAKRAGITKRVYKYLFRYSKADEIIDKLTEKQQCLVMGWELDSDMPRIYQRRYGKKIDTAVQQLSGVKPAEEIIKVLQPKTCHRCSTKNSSVSKFCYKCGCVLDIETALQIDRERQKYEEKLNKLVEDPEKLKKLVALLEGTNLPNPEG